MKQTAAKMFLNEERGRSETDWFRTLHTFNSGLYHQEHKQPFGNLYKMDEHALAGRQSLVLTANGMVLLLPVTGELICSTSKRDDEIVMPGEAQLLVLYGEEKIEIKNPYETELINFLQIGINLQGYERTECRSLYKFDLEKNDNQLQQIISGPLLNSSGFKASIGKFDGRAELIYQPANKNNRIFVYIIEGAFEVQNRLLHANDGLALWNVPELEAEALSNGAIVLVIEETGSAMLNANPEG